MQGYYERYQAGDHAEVWAELRELGGSVRDPGIHDEALAVARETMRRARHNITVLIPRLRELGYEFQYKKPFGAPPRNTPSELRKLQKVLDGPLPLSLEAWWEQVGEVCFMGAHDRLNPMAEEDVLPDPLVFAPVADALDYAEDWAEDRKREPVKTRQTPSGSWKAGIQHWREALSSRGMPEAEIEAMLAPSIERFEQEDRERERRSAIPVDPRLHYPISPDELHKANISGDTYDVLLPDAGADCSLEGCSLKQTFVEYLRRSFAWGGFPGWEGKPGAPLQEIQFLTKDLLPL